MMRLENINVDKHIPKKISKNLNLIKWCLSFFLQKLKKTIKIKERLLSLLLLKERTVIIKRALSKTRVNNNKSATNIYFGFLTIKVIDLPLIVYLLSKISKPAPSIMSESFSREYSGK